MFGLKTGLKEEKLKLKQNTTEEFLGKRWKKVEKATGQVNLKVDDKGRLSLPSYAQSLFQDGELVLSLSVYSKKVFLEILQNKDWEKKLEALKKMPPKHPKTKAYRRFLISGSVKLTLDKQFRVTLPVFMRESLKLEKEAVIVNLEDKLELWSKQVWKETSEQFINDFESLENWVECTESEEEEVDHVDIKSVA